MSRVTSPCFLSRRATDLTTNRLQVVSGIFRTKISLILTPSNQRTVDIRSQLTAQCVTRAGRDVTPHMEQLCVQDTGSSDGARDMQVSRRCGRQGGLVKTMCTAGFRRHLLVVINTMLCVSTSHPSLIYSLSRYVINIILCVSTSHPSLIYHRP